MQTTSGGTAAGRRVMLPLGRSTNSNFNWDYLNNNGRLLVQRALQWGTGNIAAPTVNLLMVVVDPNNLTTQEAAKKTLLESWDYTVNLIDESDNQTAFDDAVAVNKVVFITEDVQASTVNTKLVNATIGVVTEEANLADEFGFSETIFWGSGTTIKTEGTHYIVEPLSAGIFTVLTTSESFAGLTGARAPDLQIVAETPAGIGPATLDSGAALINGGVSAGRRVFLPWGGNNMDVNHLSDDGLTIFKRSLEWGTGLCASLKSLLLVVGDSANPTNKDSERKSLIESWCYDVTLIDDDDSQANFDATVEIADVVYVTNSVVDGTLGDKLTNSIVGIVNESGGKLDDFGFGSDVPPNTVSLNLFTATDAAHYITEPFGSSGITQFTTNITMPVASGTLAPGLYSVASIGTLTWALTTLEIGAERWDGLYSPARRVHLPFGAAETNQLTTEGLTITRRSIDWAAGARPYTGPIAHWRLDDSIGTSAIDSVGGHDGTLTNGPTWVAGQLGDALDFDGSNDYVDLTSDAELDDVFVGGATVMAWIEPAGWGENGYGRIFDKSSSPSSTNDGWVIRMNTDNGGIINFGQGFTGGRGWWKIPNGTIDLNTWQHIAVAYDASSTANDPTIYLNGSPLLVTRVDTPSGSVRSDASINLRLGNYAGGTTHTFDGKIDDARIYDRMLDSTEIADIAAGGGDGGGKEEPLPPDVDVCEGTFRDEFNTNESYAGNDGTLKWSTNWLEVNEKDGPDTGDERVTDDAKNLYVLQIRDNDGGGEGVQREADLSAYIKAAFTFEYRRDGFDNNNDYITIEVSSNGGSSWAQLERIGGSGTDSSYVPRSYDISSYIAPNTSIRFLTSPNLGSGDEFYIDNVQIAVKGCAN